MTEYTIATLTIPAEYMAAANKCAAIFDPDTGGAESFGACRVSPTGDEPATHYMASGAIKSQYIPLLTNPEQAFAALTQLAVAYGRTAPAESDVQDFCNNVTIGEPEGLVRIVEQDPAA